MYVSIRFQLEHERELTHRQGEPQAAGVDCANCPKLRDINRDLNSKLTDLQNHLTSEAASTNPESTGPSDKTAELRDAIARHGEELREVRDVYEREADALRQEVARASEALRLVSEENVREMDSLTERSRARWTSCAAP